MDSRRRVLDLIHCSVLSWLYVRRDGLEQVVSGVSIEQRTPQGHGTLEGLWAEAAQTFSTSAAKRQPSPEQPAPAVASSTSQAGPSQPSPRAVASAEPALAPFRFRLRPEEETARGLPEKRPPAERSAATGVPADPSAAQGPGGLGRLPWARPCHHRQRFWCVDSPWWL